MIICRLLPGWPIRHINAVIQAPSPKKKIINPGMNNSSKNKTSPRMNQKSSGLGKMFEIITDNLI